MNISIDFNEINWLSVVVVTIISFPLGSLWHSKLFGKAWNEDAKPKFDASKKINFFKLFGFSAISHFIICLGLDLIIGTNSTWMTGLIAGFLVSIVWIFTTMAVTHAFVGRTIRLILIDTGFYIFYLSTVGLILGAW